MPQVLEISNSTMISTGRVITALVAVVASLATPGSSMEFASESARLLEKAYVNDCVADNSPHGFYSAFLQPCEFTFRQVNDESHLLFQDEDEEGRQDMCTNDFSTVIARPVPMHWYFNITAHFNEDDWNDISNDDDFDEFADKLMLWPDQCVGVKPRCYSIQDPLIRDTLAELFDDRIPMDATHVEVDCRNDAMELSRAVYSFADGLDKHLPTIILWALTVILFSLVASLWCCYACFRACSERRIRRDCSIVITTPLKRTDYMSDKHSKECEMLLRKDYGTRIFD